MRGGEEIEATTLRLVADDHLLATKCVNIAEIEAGLRQRERRKTEVVLSRLRFLVTGREAAQRAGRYQAEWSRKGQTIEAPDALVAGTARAHGAVLVTHNTGDFPKRDLRVEHPDDLDV